MNKKIILVVMLVTLIGCKSDYSPVPSVMNGEEWSLRGVVVSEETGMPLVGHEVKLFRMQNKKCLFCNKAEAVLYVSVTTDRDGLFSLSSQVSGVYDVVVRGKTNKTCVAQESLGKLDSRELSIILKVPNHGCVLIY